VEDWNGLEPGFVAEDYAQEKTTAYALFSQMEWNFAPLWTFVTGLRFTRDEKTFDLTEYSDAIALRGPLETGQNVGLWTGKAQLEFRPIDHVLIYGGYNRGAKAGGFNVPPAGGTPPTDAEIPYKPETMNAYETGFKIDTWHQKCA
jgi:iron complex outermembrane recepter protein